MKKMIDIYTDEKDDIYILMKKMIEIYTDEKGVRDIY